MRFQIKRELDSWGLGFSNDLISCTSNVLDTRNIIVSGDEIKVDGGNWSNKMHSKFSSH